MLSSTLSPNATVESRIKEPRSFLRSLDRFFISGLIFSTPACKVLNKVLYTEHALHPFTLFSAQEVFMILEKNLNSELLHNNLAICLQFEKLQTAYENSTHEFLNQGPVLHYTG